jgi:hypothetical protein
MILPDIKEEKSWALNLLKQMCSPPYGMSMNTAAHFGVRRAKFLDSLIQEQIDLRCLPRLEFARSKKTPKRRHCAFHGLGNTDEVEGGRWYAAEE